MADKQYFADRELAYFQQFISKEKVLDEEALITRAGLNERQIVLLKPMLLAAKMIVDAPAPAPEPEPEPEAAPEHDADPED